MSAEGKSESKKLSLEEALEESNMLRIVEAKGERPTADEYRKAQAYLDELQEAASHGSESVDKMTKPLRTFTAGYIAILAAAFEVAPLAVITAIGYTGMASKRSQEELRQKLNDKLAEVLGKKESDYEKRISAFLAPARERLEKWKAEAEEFAKKQEGEFNKRQDGQK